MSMVSLVFYGIIGWLVWRISNSHEGFEAAFREHSAVGISYLTYAFRSPIGPHRRGGVHDGGDDLR